MSKPPPLPLADAVAELAGIRLGSGDLEEVLGRIADVTLRTVPGTDSASVTLYENDKPRTAAFTGRLALDLDERQYAQGSGPCLDAAVAGQTIVVDDLAAETRWPGYTPGAVERGGRSSLSMALPVQHPAQGGLNLYATAPHVFGDDALVVAGTFAGFAAVAVANARLYADSSALADQMWQALQSRAVIDQAKGIIMRDRRCTPDEAFDILRNASMRSNRKLRDIAAAVVEGVQTGQLP